ncbi:MAG TPA: hypothetical protein VML53_04540 [Thermoplasmata archaeon]|nr:hypothetical protein [Thermoplasmata archaeon]
MPLLFGTGYALLISILLDLTSPSAYATVISLFLPIFIVVGSMGGLTVFVNDRINGVLEYLIAYGVAARRLFADILLAGLALGGIVAGTTLGIGLGLYVAEGNTIPPTLVEALLVYSLPMGFATTAFTSTIGMYWSSLTSPREGMNSPTGIAPLIGLAPPAATLAVLATFGESHFLAIVGGATLVVVVVTSVLLRNVSTLLPNERFLSPA